MSDEPEIEKMKDPTRIGGKMHLIVSGASKNAGND